MVAMPELAGEALSFEGLPPRPICIPLAAVGGYE